MWAKAFKVLENHPRQTMLRDEAQVLRSVTALALQACENSSFGTSPAGAMLALDLKPDSQLVCDSSSSWRRLRLKEFLSEKPPGCNLAPSRVAEAGLVPCLRRNSWGAAIGWLQRNSGRSEEGRVSQPEVDSCSVTAAQWLSIDNGASGAFPAWLLGARRVPACWTVRRPDASGGSP